MAIYLCIFFYWTNGDLLQRRNYCLNYIFYNRRLIMSLKNYRYVTSIIVWMLAFKLLIWRRHHYRWGAANLDLCSVLMATEQWWYFSVQHLLWHGASVYNDHLRGPVILTPIAERLTVELSLPVFTALVCRIWDLNAQASPCGANA